MSAIDDRPFPRGALIAAGAMILLSLGAVGAVRVQALLSPPTPDALQAAPLAARTLAFQDAADGAVLVLEDGRLLTRIESGQGDGFIRGVLRGLARDRKLAGLGPEAPFVLAAWPDGTLTLTDTATGRKVELSGFGATNREAFTRLLAMEKPA